MLQNGVYHCDGECLLDFSGSIYALKADQGLRGLKDPGGKVKSIGYEELVDLIAESENVAGLF